MELAHFLESGDGRKRLARHFEVRRTYCPTSWSMRKGRTLCSNGKLSTGPSTSEWKRRTASPSSLKRPRALSTFDYRPKYMLSRTSLKTRQWRALARLRQVPCTFPHYLNCEKAILISLLLIFSTHHGFVCCSWFSPNWCVFALNSFKTYFLNLNLPAD